MPVQYFQLHVSKKCLQCALQLMCIHVQSCYRYETCFTPGLKYLQLL
jgi:hypothetical protein